MCSRVVGAPLEDPSPIPVRRLVLQVVYAGSGSTSCIVEGQIEMSSLRGLGTRKSLACIPCQEVWYRFALSDAAANDRGSEGESYNVVGTKSTRDDDEPGDTAFRTTPQSFPATTI